jgi:hypothetical protein
MNSFLPETTIQMKDELFTHVCDSNTMPKESQKGW